MRNLQNSRERGRGKELKEEATKRVSKGERVDQLNCLHRFRDGRGAIHSWEGRKGNGDFFASGGSNGKNRRFSLMPEKQASSEGKREEGKKS